MKPGKKRLGEMLTEAGVIDNMQLNSALGQQKQWGGKLGSVLIEMGFVDEQSIVSVLEKQLGVKCISLENSEIPQKALNAVKLDIAKKYCIMPLDVDKNTLSIAISDPTDVRTLDELSFILGVRIKPALAIESDIKNAIARYYEGVVHTGKTYKSTMEPMPSRMQIIRTETAAPFTEQNAEDMQIERGITFSPEEISEKSTDQKRTFSETVVEALTAILLEKGIITKEELARKIKEKSSKS